jgi:DNA-directed RNA polymerase subunit M/transcription elongation factor TFIIS
MEIMMPVLLDAVASGDLERSVVRAVEAKLEAYACEQVEHLRDVVQQLVADIGAGIDRSVVEMLAAVTTTTGGNALDVQRQRLQSLEAQASSGGIVCRSCKQATVIVQQKQTRSADEGMTVFCSCRTCGKQWRLG